MSMEVSVLQLGMIGTNCYIIKDDVTGKGCVIDPGDQPDRVIDAVKKSGMELAAVLLTHAHYDHTGALKGLLDEYPGVPVYLHQGDYELGTGQARAMMPDVKYRTHSYVEGSVVKVGELEFTVLHTPGHTPGCVTLKCGEWLFTGDTLFAGSMGRTDFPGGNDMEIFASLKRLAELEGDYRVCPGHESMSTLDRERKSNYYMKAAMRQ